MAGLPLVTARPQIGENPASEPPPPTWMESYDANWRLGADDTGWNGVQARKEAYLEIAQALGPDGMLPDNPNIIDTDLFKLRRAKPMDDRIWASLEARRQSDPGFLPEIPRTRAEWEMAIIDRQKTRRAKDKDIAARDKGWTAMLAGGVGSSFTDVWNVATLPIGAGGKTIVQSAARGALLNMAVEAVEQPLVVAPNRQRLGEELTTGEAVQNIAMAGIFGGVLDGAGKAVDLHGGAVARATGDMLAGGREKVLAKVYAGLPESVRAKFATMDDVPDSVLADHLEQMLGAGNMTADERAAVHVARREDEIAESNPFVRNGAGIDAHAEKLRAAMVAILGDAPPPTKSNMRTGTAISSRAVDMSPRAAVKARIGVVESRGSHTADNPNSSALGKYQFLTKTWNALYKRRFGAGGLSEEQIAAKRTNPHLQEILMDDLMEGNVRWLRQRGEAESAGNIYLVHFAGPRGAGRLLDADPTAMARDVLGADVVAANPHLNNMTAGDVIAWAHQKMGDAPSVSPGARTVLDGIDPENTLQSQLQAELDRIDAERAQIDATPAPSRVAEALDVAAAPRDDLLDGLDLPEMVRSPTSLPVLSAEQEAMIPAIREIINNPKRPSLRTDALAKRLSVAEEDIQAVLNHLSARREGIFVTRGRTVGKGDNLKIIPPRVQRLPVGAGPEDIFTFLARRGGLHPSGEIREVGANGGQPKVHDLAKQFDANPFIPGGGKLLRKDGLTIDQAGELLHEAGYINPGGEKPSVREVLDLLDTAWRDYQAKKNHYSAADAGYAANRKLTADQQAALDEFEDRIADALQERGITLDRQDVLRAHDLWDGDFDTTINRLIDEKIDAALFDMMVEEDPKVYDYFQRMDEAGYGAGTREDIPSATSAGEYGADAGNTGEGSARRGDVGGAGAISRADERPGGEPVNSQAMASFDDVDSPGPQAQAESLIHDAQHASDMFGGPTQAEKRQALERRGAGGKTVDVAQKPPGSDGGLFDTAARDQTLFALDDDGSEQTLSDILADLDEDVAMIDTIKGCL